MAENSDQILHFHQYFKIIRNRLWVIFTIFTLTVLSGYYVTNEVLPKVYMATAQIQILPRGETAVSPIGNDGSTEKSFDPINFQAEFQIMQSSDVLTPLITELQLDKIWAKREKTSLDALPPQDALDYLTGHLKLDFSRGSNIINITISSEVPKECADVANAIADRYKAMRDGEEDQRNNRGTDALRDQIAQQQKVVDDAKDAVEKMRQELGIKGVDVNGGAAISYTDLDQTDLDKRKQDLLASQEDYDARRVLLESVINLPDNKFLDTLDGLGREQPDIASLRTDVLKEETDVTNLLKDGFEENHPRILSMRAEIEAKQQQIASLVTGLRTAMTVDTNMSKSRVDLLQNQVDELRERVRKDTTNALVPFRDAQLQLERQQSLLDALNVRLQQVIADSRLQESPVRIISRAETPEYPSKPNKSLNYVASVLAGLFVGIGVAFLIEYLDTSVKTMADAETLLGLPVLTVIPNKGGPMPLIQDTGRLPHAEGYRILRAKLDLKVQNGIGPSLTMLSGGPGEGKTTTIYNLAIVCAQAGQSVILVDCDLRRPALHELLGVSNERGLSNYLRGEGEAVSFVQRTAIPKLHALTAGNMPMSEIGVLAGDKIRHMLDDLKQRYDLVLIDAPPVLGISDGSIIAREVDYVILVIQHRRYPREISLRGKRAIEEVHGNCVGMVLNCVEVKSDDSYFYYSNYGNYYQKKTKADRTKKRQDIARANGKSVAASTRKTDLESDEF
jgi:capsular exopolysaccharide synthesis family protein